MDDRESLKAKVLEALDGLPDWQLDLVARAARPMDASIGHGNPSYLLGLRGFTYEQTPEAIGRVSGEIEIGDVHLNPHRIAHGMIPFGLLDNAFGQVVSAGTGRLCVSLEIKTQFLRALRPGKVRVRADLVHAGRTIAGVEGRILKDDGALAVLATGTYFLMEDRS